MKKLPFFLFFLLFITCSNDDNGEQGPPIVVQDPEPTATQVKIEVDGVDGIDFSNVKALTISNEESISDAGIFENPYEPNGIEELPVLLIEEENLLLGYYPETVGSNKINIDDILLFYFLTYPQISVQGPDKGLLLNEIKSSANYDSIKSIVISELNNNRSPLDNETFNSYLRDFIRDVDTGNYSNSRNAIMDEVVAQFMFNYSRDGKIEWTEEVPLFANMGLVITDEATGQVVFGPELLKTKNLELSTSSIASWINDQFGDPILPRTGSYMLPDDSEYEIILSNGFSDNVDLNLAINTRNRNQFCATATGMFIGPALKTISDNDACIEAAASFYSKTVIIFTSLAALAPNIDNQVIIDQLKSAGLDFINALNECLGSGLIFKFVKILLSAVQGLLNAPLDAAELIFMMRDYFNSDITVEEIRFFENGIAFSDIKLSEPSSTSFNGDPGDNFEFRAIISEEIVEYDVIRGLSESFFESEITDAQAEGIPFNAIVQVGDLVVDIPNPILSGEDNLQGNLVVPFTLGEVSSELVISPAFNFNEIDDVIINTTSSSIDPNILGIWNLQVIEAYCTFGGDPITDVPFEVWDPYEIELREDGKYYSPGESDSLGVFSYEDNVLTLVSNYTGSNTIGNCSPPDDTEYTVVRADGYVFNITSLEPGVNNEGLRNFSRTYSPGGGCYDSQIELCIDNATILYR